MFYQCFKTIDRTVYCSSRQFQSHDPAAAWVAACMEHFGIRGNEVLGRPYESHNQPAGSVVW